MSSAEPDPGGHPAATAVVVGAEGETRVLLRGLLRLHRLRIVGEADGAGTAVELIRSHRPDLVVTDTVLSQGSVDEIVREGRALVPGLRVVIVSPASRPPPAVEAGARADVVLVRPFRIRQFAEALNVPAPAT